MDAPLARVFVVTLQGLEPPGPQPLTVLAFVTADSTGAAEAVGAAEVAAMGWTEVAVLRTGEVTDAAALPRDFAGAMETARRFGCGLIIYDEP